MRDVALAILTTVAVLGLAAGSAMLGSCYTASQAQVQVQRAQAVLGNQQALDEQYRAQMQQAEQAIQQARSELAACKGS